jgi:hypothetical protein
MYRGSFERRHSLDLGSRSINIKALTYWLGGIQLNGLARWLSSLASRSLRLDRFVMRVSGNP